MTDSDPPAVPTLPRTWRPLGPRLAAAVFAVVLVGAFAWLWMSFDDQTKAAVNDLEKATVIFFVLLGLALLNALARSRVVAREDGLTVVNGYKRRDLEWAQVIGVNLRRGAPWASLDLSDGETVAVMAIQGSDGPRAARAVRELRALIAAQTDA